MNILGTFKNIQFSNSVIAGGAASVLLYTAGALLVASGFIIPAVTVPLIGIHLFGSALTMGQVATLAIPLGHLVTAIVPDSVNQSIASLAAKLPQWQAMIPSAYFSPTDFPSPPPASSAPSNINKNEAAIQVIHAHQAIQFPVGKNGGYNG